MPSKHLVRVQFPVAAPKPLSYSRSVRAPEEREVLVRFQSAAPRSYGIVVIISVCLTEETGSIPVRIANRLRNKYDGPKSVSS